MITAFDQYNRPAGVGSGFVIGREGKIVSNFHVLEDASRAIVRFVGKEREFPVQSVVHRDPDHDLIVIEIETLAMPLPLGNDTSVKIGDRILVVGNPRGLEGTVSEGIASAFREDDEGMRLIQITAPISPGSSGGPVVDEKGEVNAKFGTGSVPKSDKMIAISTDRKKDKDTRSQFMGFSFGSSLSEVKETITQDLNQPFKDSTSYQSAEGAWIQEDDNRICRSGNWIMPSASSTALTFKNDCLRKIMMVFHSSRDDPARYAFTKQDTFYSELKDVIREKYPDLKKIDSSKERTNWPAQGISGPDHHIIMETWHSRSQNLKVLFTSEMFLYGTSRRDEGMIYIEVIFDGCPTNELFMRSTL